MTTEEIERVQFNLARVHEEVADELADREALVCGDARFTFAELTERTRRLAGVLAAHGLGCRQERSELSNHESGQSHVALYMHNGNEYLEGMLGAFKARCVPINVNYRYVEAELLYLFENSRAEALVYHACFAPMVEALRSKLAPGMLLLQVADSSGNALLPGALDYEDALAGADPRVPSDVSPDDLYALYTGGTTGMPKGVLWRQHDIFSAALYGPKLPGSIEELRARVRERPGPRALPAPPFMHGAAHWMALNIWHVGGQVVVQREVERLDPHDLLSTIEREKVQSMAIVGDAFARPLLDAMDARDYDLSSLRMLNNGGAILTAELKRALIERVPDLRIFDRLGSSESGTQASVRADSQAGGATGRFELAKDNAVLREDLSGEVEPGSDEVGWLARRGHVPLGYLGDPEKSARTFPEIEGVRYSVPGDRAKLAADGALLLLGRDSVTINSGGEKIFAEEVEQALKAHPDVYDTVVTGTPSERWGQEVTALVQLREGRPQDDQGLLDAASSQLARYKLPKRILYVERVLRQPSGKADYRWAKSVASES